MIQRIKRYFKRFWYIITDKKYKETLLKAHREDNSHIFEFSTTFPDECLSSLSGSLYIDSKDCLIFDDDSYQSETSETDGEDDPGIVDVFIESAVETINKFSPERKKKFNSFFNRFKEILRDYPDKATRPSPAVYILISATKGMEQLIKEEKEKQRWQIKIN